jgi:snoRNA binding domain, fibrillarin
MQTGVSSETAMFRAVSVTRQVLEGCKMALALDEDRADILRLVQTKMGRIAPNLSAVVGTAIAAQLMGVAGGLSSLSQMPACNIQVGPQPPDRRTQTPSCLALPPGPCTATAGHTLVDSSAALRHEA